MQKFAFIFLSAKPIEWPKCYDLNIMNKASALVKFGMFTASLVKKVSNQYVLVQLIIFRV